VAAIVVVSLWPLSKRHHLFTGANACHRHGDSHPASDPNRDACGANALALFPMFLGYSGLAISLWPNIIPPAVSIREVAAPPQAMGFTLVGALFVIPIILGYTSLSYYVFRGKVKSGEGYH
jgi:cytochrome bd-type quinol oxidase subunit 2